MIDHIMAKGITNAGYNTKHVSRDNRPWFGERNGPIHPCIIVSTGYKVPIFLDWDPGWTKLAAVLNVGSR